jgi:uncharacterized phage-associated protein
MPITSNAKTTAQDVANYFIWRVNQDDEYGENVTNLKLQKLLYYAQGFSLAWDSQPLFPEAIEAWAHGPVVRPLYFRYQSYGSSPIPTPDQFDPGSISADIQELLEEVYRVYGQYSAWGLRNLTHEEPPWRDTPQNHVIPLEIMKKFFSEHLTAE